MQEDAMKAKAKCATTQGENDHTCFFCERPLDIRHYVKAYMEAGTEALVRRFHPHGCWHGYIKYCAGDFWSYSIIGEKEFGEETLLPLRKNACFHCERTVNMRRFVHATILRTHINLGARDEPMEEIVDEAMDVQFHEDCFKQHVALGNYPVTASRIVDMNNGEDKEDTQ